MDSTLTASPTSGKTSFWKSKDGFAGKIFLGVLGCAALYGLYLILPFLISLVSNLLYLGLLSVALFALIVVVLDKDVQTFVWYAFKSLVRALRVALINSDPVGIIQNYISHLRKQYELLEEKIRELSGARKKLEDAIVKSNEEKDEQLNMVKSGQKRGATTADLAVFLNQAGRLDKSVEKYKILLGKLTLLNNLLNDMRKACKVIIADKENQVRNIVIERDAMNTGFSAFRSAISVLKGDPDKRYFYDEAMEAIENDISMKSGIIEQYVVETSEILKSVDLQNGAFEEKGMALLAKWEKEGMPALLTEASTVMNVPQMTVGTKVPQYVEANKYSNLVK